MNKLIQRIRYYRLLLRRNKGLSTHKNILRKVSNIAGVTWNGRDATKIRIRICNTWKSLDKQMATIAEKQEKFLQELASASNITDHEKSLKQIRTREATNRQFRRICTTLGWLKSGDLVGVDRLILAENGEISGWRSVTKPDELNKVITQRNRNNLHQASPTPLGHGKGYELFHGKGRHKTAR